MLKPWTGAFGQLGNDEPLRAGAWMLCHPDGLKQDARCIPRAGKPPQRVSIFKRMYVISGVLQCGLPTNERSHCAAQLRIVDVTASYRKRRTRSIERHQPSSIDVGALGNAWAAAPGANIMAFRMSQFLRGRSRVQIGKLWGRLSKGLIRQCWIAAATRDDLRPCVSPAS